MRLLPATSPNQERQAPFRTSCLSRILLPSLLLLFLSLPSLYTFHSRPSGYLIHLQPPPDPIFRTYTVPPENEPEARPRSQSVSSARRILPLFGRPPSFNAGHLFCMLLDGKHACRTSIISDASMLTGFRILFVKNLKYVDDFPRFTPRFATPIVAYLSTDSHQAKGAPSCSRKRELT